jgi:hypothetical protein
MMKKTGLLLSATFLCALLPGVASAEVAFDAAAGLGDQSWTGNLGESFTLTSPLVIDAIGVYDSNANGSASFSNGTSIEVAIFDQTTSSQVTQTYTFDAAGAAGYTLTPDGGYALQALTGADVGLTLNATDTYWIVAQGFNSNDQNGNTGNGAPAATVDVNINALGAAYDNSPTPLGIPGTPDTHSYEAGTFDFSPAPEPGTFVLFGLSSIIAIAATRRRKVS